MKRTLQTIKSKVLRVALYSVGMFGATTSMVFAQGADLKDGADKATPSGYATNLTAIIETIAKTLIILVGLVSVIMLIIGGFRYVVSGGDSDAVSGAKNTILYAIIGLVVAFLSFAAVNFVIGQLSPGTVTS